MSTSVLNKGKSWVAFDSGLTGVSRGHLEETIQNHAKKLKLDIEWLITHQLTSGARRIAFTIAADDSKKLAKLLADLNNHFPNFAGEDELRDLIQMSSQKTSGRVVTFPIEIDLSSPVSAKILISKSSIDQIIAVGEELPNDAIIKADNFVRPTLVDGKLVLYVERIAGGYFAPVERQSPHECCGGHDAEEPIYL